MVVINAEHITSHWADYCMFDDIQFAMEDSDKVGLVGVNGVGKSTFLRMIAGLDTPDSGTVIRANGLRIGYLPQAPDFSEEISVIEQVFRGAKLDYDESQVFEVKAMLTQLDVKDFDKPVTLLSGGQKKRVAIASAMFSPCELLILDEPTNHIDNETVEWLEEQLRAFKGAVLTITHDRYFLSRVTNRICELDRGKLYSYQENYEGFLRRKAEREASAIASERKRQSLLKKELEWIQRGARARGTKSRSRIERFEALSEQAGPQARASVDMQSVSTRLGKKTIEVEHLCKGWDGVEYIRDFNLIVARDDRIGIVGRNGTGKSTFMRLLMGDTQPDSGRIVFGDTVRLGYFSQDCGHMDSEQKVIEYIRDVAETVHTPDGDLSGAQMLEKFLFPGEMQWTRIGDLSGGERRRLYLLRVLMDAPNILLLDEPTNDLDIETLSVLEQYLEQFQGAVLCVSHDRWFLDKTVRRIFEFGKHGVVQEYLGNYSDYKAKKQEEQPQSRKSTPSSAEPRKKAGPAPKRKLNYKEQYDYEHIDGEIAELEEKIAAVEAESLTAATDFVRLQQLTEQKQELERQLDEKTERWLELQELVESLN